ncbi:MAG: gamma-glutamyl-gamma-aminobutyrate hydrolase family protein [Bacilli bacterium]|nr:gamma-glutamyl-gamma-aminobutyrate hydrolase family protein [Bacilli bacterium]
MKPIIGIVEWPYTDKDGDLIYEVINPIIEKVSQYGGIPIGIFPTQIENYQNKKINEIKKLTLEEKDDLNQSLKICDAIIKPGALRIYGYEKYIYNYAFEKNMPYIGICAGMQLMAAHQKEMKNVRNSESNVIHHSKEEYAHSIKIMKDTLLYNILKKDEIMVNSRHNYHIENPGINKISAYSEDSLIEAIENPTKDFQIGLQWHPEMLNDENTEHIFESFIYEANKYKLKRK